MDNEQIRMLIANLQSQLTDENVVNDVVETGVTDTTTVVEENNPQDENITNGGLEDDTVIVNAVDTTFEETSTDVEVIGVDELLSQSIDLRLATMQGEIDKVKTENDKLKVALSQILSRISLVETVTDKVVTVDTDTLLTDSIKMLI